MLRPLKISKLLLALSDVDSYGRNRASETGFYDGVTPPLIWFNGALALFDAEKDAASNFQNFDDALWWSAVTKTTVGY